MQIFKAPQAVNYGPDKFSIFLGGSIEMGKARDWQQELTDWLSKHPLADRICSWKNTKRKPCV